MTNLEKMILFSERLTRTEKIVMLYLALILEKKGEAYVDFVKAANYVNLSLRHFYRVVQQLDRKGIVKVDWDRYGTVKFVKLTDTLKEYHKGGES